MDVGVANTTRTYTGRRPLIGRMWEKRKRRPSICARPVSPCGAHPPGKHRSPSCTSARAALRILSRFRAGMRLLSSPLVHRGAESREVGQDRLVPQRRARRCARPREPRHKRLLGLLLLLFNTTRTRLLLLLFNTTRMVFGPPSTDNGPSMVSSGMP